MRVVTIVLVFLLFSCGSQESKKKEQEKQKGESLIEYFYPFDDLTAPVTYLYRNSKNPLDERYAHLIPMHRENDTAFIVERFNGNLKLTEAFQLVPSSSFISIKKHKVATPLTKYDAKLKAAQWFPLSTSVKAHFSSNYPENDSIIQVWDQTRSFESFIDDFEYKGEQVKAAKIKSTIQISRFDQKNKKQQKAVDVVLYEYWVKDVGLVKTHPADNEEFSYNLFKVLSQKEWARLFEL